MNVQPGIARTIPRIHPDKSIQKPKRIKSRKISAFEIATSGFRITSKITIGIAIIPITISGCTGFFGGFIVHPTISKGDGVGVAAEDFSAELGVGGVEEA